MSGKVRETVAGGTVDVDAVAGVVRRLAPVALIFAVAFVADRATGQRSSSVWGSAAIVASVVVVVPAVRPALAALGGYGAVWVVFNLARAVADDLPLALTGQGVVAGWERGAFGDTLPSAWLQARLFEPDRTRVYDISLSVAHGSFFVVPFVVAALLWFRCRRLFPRYLAATAVTFAAGVIGFLLLPTAPPWMAAPAEVTRVTHHLLVGSGIVAPGAGPGFAFEPNPLAAMPSIHVAATVLVYLAARSTGRLAGMAGALYALLMTVAVVYLGEHYVLDALTGWVVALASWKMAIVMLPADSGRVSRRRSGWGARRRRVPRSWRGG